MTSQSLSVRSCRILLPYLLPFFFALGLRYMAMLPGCINLRKLFNDWISVPEFIYRMKELPSSAKVLISILYSKIEDDGITRISRSELADYFGWSVRTVDRAIKDCKECGLIATVQESESSPSEYHFRDYKGYHELIGGTDNIVRGVLTQQDLPSCNKLVGTDKYDSSNNTTTTTTTLSFKKDNTPLQTEKRPQLKRRKTEVANNGNKPVLKLRSKLANPGSLPSSKIKEKSNSDLQTDSENQNEYVIPKRTREAIDYWLAQPCLPKMVINLNKPTKRLKATVLALGKFFSGKLFNGSACVSPDLSSKTLKHISHLNSMEDFKEFVDVWVDVITSNRYRVNPSYLKKISLHDWLMGNPHVLNNNGGGMYSPLIENCYYEPALATTDKNPVVTESIIELWEKFVGDSSGIRAEEFMKVTNVVTSIFDREYKRSGIDPSGESMYSGALYLVVEVLANNKEFLSQKSPKPSVLLGNWAKEQYLALWSKI